MYARNVYFRVKSLSMAAEFAHTLETEVLPVLREQEGFKGEVTLANPGSLEQIAISLWEKKDQADVYQDVAYSKVLKVLARVIEGTPKVRTYEAVTLNVGRGTADD